MTRRLVEPQRSIGAAQRERRRWLHARLLVSPDGRVLFSDHASAELGFVDAFGRLSSARAVDLLRWIHVGYLSECSTMKIPDWIPERGRWLEISVRRSPVDDIYVLQAVSRLTEQ